MFTNKCRRFLSITLLVLCVCGCSAVTADNPAKTDRPSDCVVLLHGLGRTALSMNNIEEALTADGYRVWNDGYASRSDTVEVLAEQTLDEALKFCREQEVGRVHFVTHSLGGILVRQYLHENTVENLGRVVMLAPPNRGSEIVDKLKENMLFRWILGPAGRQLGTGEDSVPVALPARVEADVGIITGNRTSDPWFSPLIPGADDGKVSVASARLETAQDFLVLPYGHTTIMNKAAVTEQVRHFLKHGRFVHDDTAPRGE